jgi:circadian clock protein KaiC
MAAKRHKGLVKAQVGIQGFDAITGGGLPRGRVTLVVGSSGCGKTVFGMEFLIHGVRQFGEPGAFVSFEETEEELAANFSPFGFDLERLEAEKKLVLDYIGVTPELVIEAGEYDLEGLLLRLEKSITGVGARRVVLDALPALFQGFTDAAAVRLAISRLFAWLKQRGITTVATAEDTTELFRHGLGRSLSGCIVHLSMRVRERIATRYLQVTKYRGSSHKTDEFPFLISETGLPVLPLTSVLAKYPASSERVSTGLPRLDTMMGGGGYYRGSSILVSGQAGTGKTSLAVHLAVSTCRLGERCLYCAFEESEAEIVRNMRAIGLDLSGWIDEGLLNFIMSRATSDGLELRLVELEKMIREFRPQVAVFDPISNFTSVGSYTEVKSMTSRLLDIVKTGGITSLFTTLVAGGQYCSDVRAPGSEAGVSSLMDTWIDLQSLESGGEQSRLIRIIKSRGMAHSNQLREFLITESGIELVDVYEGPSGMLTGTARAAEEARLKEERQRRKRETERKRGEQQYRQAGLEAQIAVLQAELEKSKADLEQINENARAYEKRLSEQRTEMGRLRRADARDEGKEQL